MTRSRREIMTGLAEEYAAAKGQTYDATEYSGRNKAVSAFSGGKEANTVRSFNVLVDHLDVLKDATAALKNNNVRALNVIGNTIETEFGEPAPTNFDAVKSIVADELAKAVVGTGGALGDREAIAATINKANSPQALLGVISNYQKLATGQLSGLRKQYESTTGRKDFDRFLDSRTKSLFSKPASGSDTGVSGTSGPVKWEIVQ